MKQLFKTMNHDINQMKDEITVKDHSLVKEHFDHHKVEKKKIKIKNELTKIRKQIESSQQIQNSQLIEISKLNSIIQEAEEEEDNYRNERAKMKAMGSAATSRRATAAREEPEEEEEATGLWNTTFDERVQELTRQHLFDFETVARDMGSQLLT